MKWKFRGKYLVRNMATAWGAMPCIGVHHDGWRTERRRRAARRCHGAEKRGGRRLHFPRPASPWAASVFREGRAGPLAAEPGNRASFVSVRLGRRSTTTPVTRYTRAHLSRTLDSNASCTRAYERAAKIVSSWPGTARGRCTPVTSGAMVPALLVLALAALAPAAARRHAPDLREDEPARRATRPAGEC